MTTKDINRAISTLEGVMSFSFLLIVALSVGLVGLILKVCGVISSADSSSFAFILLALLFQAMSYKSLDKLKDELYREHHKASEREGQG